jgi:8-oxo-dGTP pyrophosphatase MutT (NUDIX family)
MDKVKVHFTAGGILQNNENKIYLIFNKQSRTYQLPKGHMEKGERPQETALREVREETGYRNIKIISSKTFKLFYKFKDKYSNGQKSEKHTLYFIMKLINTERIHTQEQYNEKLSGDWFYIDEAIKKVSFDNIREILIEFKNINI